MKCDKKFNEKIAIQSLRAVDKWASRDIVNNYEESFCELNPNIKINNINKIKYIIKKLLRNRRLNNYSTFENLFKKIQKYLLVETDEIIFMICMNSDDMEYCDFYRSKKLKVVYIIDAWENQIEYISRKLNNIDVILMAYQDSIDLLKKYVSPSVINKIFLFPLFINPLLYPCNNVEKKFDLIQVGRQNERLHEWALEYSSKNNLSYLYQKKNDRGIYYFENEIWDYKNFQLSYSRLIDTISKTKIAIVSPPNSTDSKRTGVISPLTPRYLETAMCFTVPVGLIPSGYEYKQLFPKDFTIVPKSFDEFQLICNNLINDNKLMEKIVIKNRKFVIENNSVNKRYSEFEDIIMNTIRKD